jgi:hypothetical protein
MKFNDNSTPFEITQLATNLTENIFEEVEKEFEKQDKSTNLNLITNNDRENLLEKLSTNNIFRDNAPSLPQSIATTHPSSIQSTSRPLMFVPLDSGFNITKAFSPLLDIVTTKSTPKITTSVTVISPPQPELSSTTTTNINSDDEEQLNSTSTLMPNSIASDRSKFLQNSSKESSIDSNDTNLYDNTTLQQQQQQNTGSATPARSLISDYDNLHGSYGSLSDDTQQLPPPPPPPSSSSSSTSEAIPSIPTTNTSSISTIYESLDTAPSSSSTPTFVSALSTLANDNTSGSEIATKRINSDISDEDLVESHDIETPILTSINPFRSSKGRIASHYIQIIKHEHIYSVFLLACLNPPCISFFASLF